MTAPDKKNRIMLVQKIAEMIADHDEFLEQSAFNISTPKMLAQRIVEAALSSPAPTDRAQYVVLVTNNDGGHPATILNSLKEAQEWIKNYLKVVDRDNERDNELDKLFREIDAIDGEFVESIHTSDAWKENIYISPLVCADAAGEKE